MPTRTRARRSKIGPRRSRNSAPKPPRLGAVFYTVVAVTGLCALAFLGLVASVLAGI